MAFGINFKKRIFSLPSLSVLLIVVVFLALFFGAYSMSVSEVFDAVLKNKNEASNYLILNIRLPRILLAALVGAGLSISGAAIQGLFRNPLADQTLIGVTSGAMLFAVLAIVFMGSILASFSEFLFQFLILIFAFAGGLLTTYVVYLLSRKNGQTEVMTMLLAGIAVSAFAGAVTGVFIYLSDNEQLRDITFWSMGSLSGASWMQLTIATPVILTGIFFLTRFDQALNAILLGEKEAVYLGISVEKVKAHVILLTSLIVGICIGMCGIIGFVGLVIPHFLRLIYGTDNRYLIRSSALTGAIFLVLTDTLARTIIAPAELPIGILTAIIGAPFFLWLLIQERNQKLSL